jgi:autotransporter-associated beta strand protein
MMYLGANSNLYLNSGTVQAKGSMTIKSANATATGTGNIYVQAGGGVIDTDSFTVTSSLAFQHDTSSLGSAKDGGLTKLGAGTLNLNVVNTYTGDTVIKGGTLITGVNGALGNTVVGFGNTSGTTGILNLNGISQQIGGLYGGDNYAGYVQNNTGSVVLTINSSGSTSFAGGILSGISIVKTGTGTQTLTGEINNYDGSTTVNQGTLLITGSGKIESTSGVTVNGGVFDYASSVVLDRDVIVDGGVFKYNSAAVYSGNLTFTSGVIGGNGNFTSALSIGAGQVIAPGNSAGNFKTGAQTWLTGGAYEWEISAMSGAAGTDWDLLTISGVLNLEGIDANGFSLLLSSLTDLSGFDSSQAYAWEIATASGGIVGFDVGKFLIDADGLSGFDPAGFSLYLDSSSLFLKYEMIPEPSTWGLLLAGAAMLTVGVLRRRKSTVKC